MSPTSGAPCPRFAHSWLDLRIYTVECFTVRLIRVVRTRRRTRWPSRDPNSRSHPSSQGARYQGQFPDHQSRTFISNSKTRSSKRSPPRRMRKRSAYLLWIDCLREYTLSLVARRSTENLSNGVVKRAGNQWKRRLTCLMSLGLLFMLEVSKSFMNLCGQNEERVSIIVNYGIFFR